MALARAWKQMSWFYYQYLLVTSLYMLEPWERTVFILIYIDYVKNFESGDSYPECRARLVNLHPPYIFWTIALGYDSMLVSIVGMALYTGYVFMPQHVMAILHYFEIVQ